MKNKQVVRIIRQNIIKSFQHSSAKQGFDQDIKKELPDKVAQNKTEEEIILLCPTNELSGNRKRNRLQRLPHGNT